MSKMKTGVVLGVVVTLFLALAIAAAFMGPLGAFDPVETASSVGASSVEIGIRSVIGGIWNAFGWWLWVAILLPLLWWFITM